MTYLVAFCTSVLLVFLVRKVALRLKLFDPVGPLKIHKRQIPRLGGIGLLGGTLAGIVAAHVPLNGEHLELLGALLIVWMTSLIDDLRELQPLTRLMFHVVAGLLVSNSGLAPIPDLVGLPNTLLTCIYVITFINAFNFLDGSDGLAAGAAALIALGYSFLLMERGNPAVAFAVSLSAACTGFLIFNFPPASIFMGDSGSTTLGFSIAVLGLEFSKTKGKFCFITPLVLATVPLSDFAFAVLRRLIRRRSIFQGDRSHFYDLMLQKGWSPRRIALVSYGAVFICVVAAILSST